MAHDPDDWEPDDAPEGGDGEAASDPSGDLGAFIDLEGGPEDLPSVLPAEISGAFERPSDLSDPSIDRPLPMRNRIAQTFREQLTVEAGGQVISNLREVAFPLGALLGLLVLVITFRSILLPFIFAVALVFLMEPIVSRLSRNPTKPRGLPRWVAVILVYLVFITVVSISSILIIPTFVTEIVRFAEEVPEYIADFRNEQLPGLNRDVQSFLRNYLPVKPQLDGDGMEAAQGAIAAARMHGARQATAYGNAMSRVRHASDMQVLWRVDEVGGEALGSFIVSTPDRPMPDLTIEQATETTGWSYSMSERQSALVLTPDAQGGMRVHLNDVAIEVEKVDEGAWVIRRQRGDVVPVRDSGMEIDEIFDLERRLDTLLGELVSMSNERIGALIDFAQKFLVGILAVFVGLILTLMVAAFISIDLPRVMAFLRGLVPATMRGGYDVLLTQLERGLSGVVRGQLLICAVNGFLTWLGLAIFGVKFSVLLAVVAGIMSLIPVFGTILSTIPIVLIALTDGFMKGVIALVWILFIHALEANLLNPKIIGSSAHIHPVIVIFALLAGESAYGLVGALLAVPTASILLTLFNFVRTKAWKQAEVAEPSS